MAEGFADMDTLQILVLLLGLVLFLYSMATLSGTPHGLKRLTSQEVVEYVQLRKLDPVDVVLMTPFVKFKPSQRFDNTKSGDTNSGDTNYSAMSVFRFAPWVRRIHLFDPDIEHHPENHLDHWISSQKSRVVYFHQDLLEYSLSSPFLAEKFIVLKPNFLITNYVFSWQFFVGTSPVIRNCNTGLMPLTRSLLNECIYQNIKPEHYYRYSVWKGIQDGNILYEDNEDHFIAPCSQVPVTTTRAVSVFSEEQIQSFFRFKQVAKNREKPHKILLNIICNPHDDIHFDAWTQNKDTVQVWVHLTDLKDASSRLSFFHRMIVNQNIFIEIQPNKFKWKPESVAAEVMRRLRSLSQNEPFSVTRVCSYWVSKDWRESLCNEIGNKLAMAYETGFDPFTVSEEQMNDNDLAEWQRLSHL